MRRAVGWVLACLVLAAGLGASLGQGLIDGIARDNLSNATFERGHLETPADYGIAYVSVTVPSDGLRLAAWWMPGPSGHGNATTAIVIAAGLGSNMSKVVRQWAPNLHGAGYSVLAVDLRNHGASDDGPNGYVSYGDLESRDLAAAVALLRDHAQALAIDPGRIVLYGESMAATASLLAAGPSGAAAVIADSGFASFADEARRDGRRQGYPAFVVSWVLDRMDRLSPGTPTAVDAAEAVATLQVPFLLAHCSNDERVAPTNLNDLLARWGTQQEAPALWFQPCPLGPSPTHHVDGWAQPGYNQTVLDFLAGALGKTGK